jgi:prevent-host-death family protein
MQFVPIYQAKNQLSELIAAVEAGEEVTITRRGAKVACLVPCHAPEDAARRQADVSRVFERLRVLRVGVAIDGDLKSIARAGLD